MEGMGPLVGSPLLAAPECARPSPSPSSVALHSVLALPLMLIDLVRILQL